MLRALVAPLGDATEEGEGDGGNGGDAGKEVGVEGVKITGVVIARPSREAGNKNEEAGRGKVAEGTYNNLCCLDALGAGAPVAGASFLFRRPVAFGAALAEEGELGDEMTPERPLSVAEEAGLAADAPGDAAERSESSDSTT